MTTKVNAITCRTPSKVNLALEVGRPEKDGYHPLVTVFVPVSVYDTLTFELTPGPVELNCRPDPGCPVEENLVYRAAMMLQKRYSPGRGVLIHVEKNIPPGAGLGGGSSDCACTLLNLCRLWGINPKPGLLQEMALQLGSDVPFFLNPVPSLGRGRGEILTPVNVPVCLYLIIVCPPFGVSTPKAYHEWDLAGYPAGSGSAKALAEALRTGDVGQVARNLRNDLEGPVSAMHPQISEIRQALLKAGAMGSLMSGSGSAVFGIFPAKADAQRAISLMDGCGRVFLATTKIKDNLEIR